MFWRVLARRHLGVSGGTRWLSTVLTAGSGPVVLNNVESGGGLVVRVASKNIGLRIHAGWEEHPRLESSSADVVYETVENVVHVTASSKIDERTFVDVVIPQRFSVSATSPAEITVSEKVEGDVDLRGRTVVVDSVRGELVRLVATDSVEVRKLAEGTELWLEATLLSVAKINGAKARLRSSGSSGKPASAKIKSAYCTSLEVQVYNAESEDNVVSIDNMNGHADVTVDRGNVAVHRISGSAKVAVERGDVQASFDALSPKSTSELTSSCGNVDVCLSTEISIEELDLTGLEVSVDDRADLTTTEREQTSVRGSLAGKIEPSRKRGAGKINVNAAEAQRWDSAVSKEDDGPRRTSLRASAPGGRASLKVLGWIEGIKLKFGLENT